MTRILNISILVLFLTISVSAQDGISFTQENMEKVFEQAKKENKIIFVDAYTTWCGPCKWMSKNVFTDEKVAAFYNDRFINVKLDMEVGEGLAFADKYEVKAYPTLFYLDAEGEVVHKGLGSRDTDSFIGLGQSASDPATSLQGLGKRYESGDKSSELLLSYSTALLDANMDAKTVAGEYLASQKDWLTEDNIRFIYGMMGYDLNGKHFQYFVDNKQAFSKVLGEKGVDDRLSAAISYSFTKETTPDQMGETLKKYYPKTWEQKVAMQNISKLMYSKENGDNVRFFEAAKNYFNSYNPTDANFLNSIAWRVYELFETEDYMVEARKWAAASIASESNSYNNDTMAAILFKLKIKNDALRFANLAIELAKEEGNDAAATVELKEKIMQLQDND